MDPKRQEMMMELEEVCIAETILKGFPIEPVPEPEPPPKTQAPVEGLTRRDRRRMSRQARGKRRRILRAKTRRKGLETRMRRTMDALAKRAEKEQRLDFWVVIPCHNRRFEAVRFDTLVKVKED